MSPRVLAAFLACSVVLCPPARSQENLRTLEGSGTETKYLTPNGRDIWKIEMEVGETLLVHISTRDFDPVLRLIGPGEEELLQVDDEGSESRFARRVEEDGEYRIVVHGFEDRGGGNYQLAVQELRAKPIEFGTELVLNLDRHGQAYCRFEASRGEVVVPVLTGQLNAVICLDPAGAPIVEWIRTFQIAKSGEHLLSLRGAKNTRLRVRLERARREALPDGATIAGELAPREMHIYEMSRAALDFRTLELIHRDGVHSRLVRTGSDDARSLRRRGFDLRTLPVLSKGLHQRYAAVFGRDEPYELQVLSVATTSREYRLSLADPRRELAAGTPAASTLVVGGSDFFSFEARPGQLFQVALTSGAFDSFLRLYDEKGQELTSDDDGGRDLDSNLSFLARQRGTYLLQVASRGDGGGGAYELALTEREIPTLAPGQVRNVRLGVDGPHYWHFEGRAGQTLLLSIRSKNCDPSVEVFGPDGVVVGRDQDGGVDRDCLLPMRLNHDGRHTFRIDARGEGEGELQLIPLD